MKKKTKYQKTIIPFISVFVSGQLSAQLWNPAVYDAAVSPSPLQPLELNGIANNSFTFELLNDPYDPANHPNGSNVQLSICPLNLGPLSGSDPLLAFSGTGLNFFSVTYDTFASCWNLIQSAPLPADTPLNFSWQMEVTHNTGPAWGSVAANGFNVNLQSANVMASSNNLADDQDDFFVPVAAVPEPSAVSLAFLSLASLIVPRRR